MDDDFELSLSSAALEALKEFAVERGIAVESDANDIREDIQKALDVEPREDSFKFTFGEHDEITIRLNGLRRDIGQTLQSTGLTLWRAGDFLSNYMYENRSIFNGKSVLEVIF